MDIPRIAIGERDTQNRKNHYGSSIGSSPSFLSLFSLPEHLAVFTALIFSVLHRYDHFSDRESRDKERKESNLPRSFTRFMKNSLLSGILPSRKPSAQSMTF